MILWNNVIERRNSCSFQRKRVVKWEDVAGVCERNEEREREFRSSCKSWWRIEGRRSGNSPSLEGVKGRRVGRLTVGLWDGIENHGRQTRAAINLSLAQTSIRLCIQEYVMSRGCPPNFSSKPSTLLTRPLSLCFSFVHFMDDTNNV